MLNLYCYKKIVNTDTFCLLYNISFEKVGEIENHYRNITQCSQNNMDGILCFL